MKPPLYYRLAIAVACPLYRLFLAYKKNKLPHYAREVAERFGQTYLPISHDKPIIWCHAVSLGELNTAYPLLKLFLDNGYHLWITSTTQTGFHRAGVLFGDKLGKSVQHSFVPVDNPRMLDAFLHHVRPVLAVFVETELWANTLYLLYKKNIPSVMANARLTQKSFQNYAKFSHLSQSMMANLSLIIAQDGQSHQNFITLGANADKVKIAHSLKWSGQLGMVKVADQPKPSRPIWIMASTHDGEEQIALTTHKKLQQDFPELLLILVPRHPERFEEVANLCKDFVCHRRSRHQLIQDDTQVYLADSMGELMMWYQMADVAVVGGSFVDKGGHNPIEPAALAKPIIMGQYVKNCVEIVHDFKEIGALVQSDDNGLYEAVKAYLSCPDTAYQAGKNAQDLVAQKQNADKVQFMIIKELLS